MAANPIGIIAIIITTLTFTGLLYGNELAANSFPALLDTDYGTCTSSGLDAIGCYIGKTVAFVLNIFIVIYGGAVFLFNLISFNIPGTPWYVRTIIGSVLGGGILWSVVSLLRGN